MTEVHFALGQVQLILPDKCEITNVYIRLNDIRGSSGWHLLLNVVAFECCCGFCVSAMNWMHCCESTDDKNSQAHLQHRTVNQRAAVDSPEGSYLQFRFGWGEVVQTEWTGLLLLTCEVMRSDCVTFYCMPVVIRTLWMKPDGNNSIKVLFHLVWWNTVSSSLVTFDEEKCFYTTYYNPIPNNFWLHNCFFHVKPVGTFQRL